MSVPAYFTGRPGPRTCVEVGGISWDIDTNGEAFVAMRHVIGPTLEREEREARIRVFARYLEQARPADAVASDVATLVSLLGKAEYPHDSPCPANPCMGVDCAACDGDGMVYDRPDMRRTWVLARPFDANLIAVSLEVAAAAGPCALWIDALDGSLVIDGGDWRAVVMPMRAPRDEDRPVWDVAPRVHCEARP